MSTLQRNVSFCSKLIVEGMRTHAVRLWGEGGFVKILRRNVDIWQTRRPLIGNVVVR